MANTYIQIYIHIVIVVKGRHCLIPKDRKEILNKYVTGIINNKKHKLLAINGIQNHIHILIGYNPVEGLSDLVKELKRCTTNFINEQKWINGKFAWQEGYGAFSYSRSHLNNIINYIRNQENHHKKMTFKEEYLDMLKKFEIVYNEKYIFKDVD